MIAGLKQLMTLISGRLVGAEGWEDHAKMYHIWEAAMLSLVGSGWIWLDLVEFGWIWFSGHETLQRALKGISNTHI